MSKNFKFYSEYNLPVLLGIKAKNVNELLEMVKTIPPASVYYHTHRFLTQHHYLIPEPPNDFAYWLRNVLNLRELSEKVSSINIASIINTENLRAKLIHSIDEYPKKEVYGINCTPGDEFQFMSCKTFILPLHYEASNLRDFLNVIQRITINTFYCHIFGAQLRLGRNRNDFADWFDSIGEKELAERVATIDPYTTTLEGLRNDIIQLVKQYDKSQ